MPLNVNIHHPLISFLKGMVQHYNHRNIGDTVIIV